MALTDAHDKILSEQRAKKAQRKDPPFLIRDDGMLFPHTRLTAMKTNYRPYHGDVSASIEDRMRYLKGLAHRRKVIYDPADDAPFDIGKADTEALMQFALEQYGAVLDPSKSLKVLRQEVFNLAQLDDPRDSATARGGPVDDDDDPDDEAVAEARALAQRASVPAAPAEASAPAPARKTAKRGQGLGLATG